jgi:hypothetical protein
VNWTLYGATAAFSSAIILFMVVVAHPAWADVVAAAGSGGGVGWKSSKEAVGTLAPLLAEDDDVDWLTAVGAVAGLVLGVILGAATVRIDLPGAPA